MFFYNNLNTHFKQEKNNLFGKHSFIPLLGRYSRGLKFGLVLFTQFLSPNHCQDLSTAAGFHTTAQMKGLGFRTSSCATCLNKCYLQIKKEMENTAWIRFNPKSVADTIH